MGTAHAVRFGVLLVVCGFGLGCLRFERSNLPPKPIAAQPWNEIPGPGSGGVGSTAPQSDQAAIQGLALALSQNPPTNVLRPPVNVAQSRPLNVLALSAGGKYGAYSAGVLCGWTTAGTRPQFDVVTGVSTGAILAVYAIVGPKYDHKLKEFFTTIDDKDLFKYRPAIDLIRYGSIGTAEPMKKIIEASITEEYLTDLRIAHAEGRRLFLGTLNLQTKRLVVWDVGAIASSGRPDSTEMVRKIILAACSIPGLLPAVEFDVTVNGERYTELHADGGAVTQTFMKFGPHATPAPGTKWLEGSNLYAISAGKLYADPSEGKLKFLARISAGVSSSLYSLYRAELLKLYVLCLTSGMSYNLVLLPNEYQGDPKSTTIDPVEMTKLFNIGYQQCRGGVPWRNLPPGGLDGEEDVPRGGTNFALPTVRP